MRAAVAAVLGASIGALCAFVPEEAREVCRAVARLASIVLGAG